MLIRITLAFLAVLALDVTLAGPCPAQSGERAILARSGETSILIWNAFPYLKGLEGSSMSTQDAERELRSKAFAVLVEGSRPLKGARTVRLLTVIQKPSDQSSFVYRTTTFSDSQTLFTMEAKRADVLAKTALWSRELKSGSTPRNLKIAWDNHLPS
jgi:hypothetical protein